MAKQGQPPDLDEVLNDLLRKFGLGGDKKRPGSATDRSASNRHSGSTMRDAAIRRNALSERGSSPSQKSGGRISPSATPPPFSQSEHTKVRLRRKPKQPFVFYLFLVVFAFLFFRDMFPDLLSTLSSTFQGAFNDLVNDVSRSEQDWSLSAESEYPAVVESVLAFFGELSMFESMGFALLIGGVILLFLFLRAFVRIVPQNEAFIVERLGKYDRTLLAGFHITIPVVERVAYKHSLKEYAIDVASQHAITRDNVVLGIDGVLYLKIMDPRAASYGVDNLEFAITQLAQTSMRAEIGKLSLDDTFESRENVNAKVTQAIDEASEAWGTKVLRYEVKDITPPASILEEMEKQMGAERQRRVDVTTSEGYRQAQINQAEGDREAQILRAQGIAESMTIEATARAEAIRKISEAINAEGGSAAVAQQLAEQYVSAFDKLAREGTIALLPGDGADVASMVAKAYTAFDGLKDIVGKPGAASGSFGERE